MCDASWALPFALLEVRDQVSMDFIIFLNFKRPNQFTEPPSGGELSETPVAMGKEQGVSRGSVAIELPAFS